VKGLPNNKKLHYNNNNNNAGKRKKLNSLSTNRIKPAQKPLPSTFVWTFCCLVCCFNFYV